MIYLLLRTAEPATPDWIPNWFVYSLPDGLWAFAYALFITNIWSGSRSRLKIFWMSTIPVLVLGFEFLQYAGIVRGTFCLQDLALGIMGIIAGVFFGLNNLKLNHHENPSE
jgi:hypothetical protein